MKDNKKKTKKVSNFGWKRSKKPILKNGDVVTQDLGYTIKTSLGTLWRGLPKNYKLKGKIIGKEYNSDYQGQPANKFKMERISKSPRGKRLRKNYLVWQLKNGTLIR